jgi:hypothetical protein
MRVQSVQQLALSVRQRADLGGQQNAFGSNISEAFTDQEMLTLLNGSVGVVWDVLIEKFPENYSWGYDGNASGQGYMFPIIQGVYEYNLPFDFYKEKGVDLGLDQTLQNWATMRPYSIRDRNMFSYPLQTALAYAGWQNMRWQIQGNKINFLPKQGPLPGNVRLLYATAAPILAYPLPAAYATSTTYAQNSLIYVPLTLETGETVNQVFIALNAGTSGGTAPTWVVPGSVTDNGIVWAYQAPLSLYATSFDGISGYEDLVVLDAAIKASVQIEQDCSAMLAQRAEWMDRIQYASANRNSGDPLVVSGGFGMAEGGPNFGGGFGPWGAW